MIQSYIAQVDVLRAITKGRTYPGILVKLPMRSASNPEAGRFRVLVRTNTGDLQSFNPIVFAIGLDEAMKQLNKKGE